MNSDPAFFRAERLFAVRGSTAIRPAHARLGYHYRFSAQIAVYVELSAERSTLQFSDLPLVCNNESLNRSVLCRMRFGLPCYSVLAERERDFSSRRRTAAWKLRCTFRHFNPCFLCNPRHLTIKHFLIACPCMPL
jgi:hypothetical protein